MIKESAATTLKAILECLAYKPYKELRMNPMKEANRLIEKKAVESWKLALLEDLGTDFSTIEARVAAYMEQQKSAKTEP